MNKKHKYGVLLVNLGTPDYPTPVAIRRYLKQFLSDVRIIDLPRWWWLPILNFVILPIRSRRVAKLYQLIWTKEGSPLLAFSKQQKQLLQQQLNQSQHHEFIVELGMSYGNPSMQSAMDSLMEQQVDKIIVLPLYPQYSSTTTGSVFDAFSHTLKSYRNIVPFEFIHSYHSHPKYIAALKNSITNHLKRNDKLIFSFHGIPVRYAQQGDPYSKQCKETAELVAQQLGLTSSQWQLTFQSRFGKEEWLQPYTDKTLASYPAQGIQDVAIVSPGFASDCLETLEEISQENKKIFLDAGGNYYHYIPALNANPEHIQLLVDLVVSKSNY